MYVTVTIKTEDGTFPGYFYFLVTSLYILHRVSWLIMGLALLSFYNKISDPLVGGTYMTLLNTFANLGNKAASSFSLWFVDQITFK